LKKLSKIMNKDGGKSMRKVRRLRKPAIPNFEFRQKTAGALNKPKELKLTCYAAAAVILAVGFTPKLFKDNTSVYTGSSVSVEASNKSVKPMTAVPYDLNVEENYQKSVDAGHSPWKLDPVYVAQVFLSLKLSPEGIKGEYPIRYEDIKLIENTGTDAIAEVTSDKTDIKKVFLKRLIRQDKSGIWTVIGYDIN